MTNIQISLDALSVETRRNVLDLVGSGISTAGDIADHLPVSRSAVSQHLKVLLDAEMVSVETQGTRRLYTLDRTGLMPIAAYLDRMWGEALTRFADYVDDQA